MFAPSSIHLEHSQRSGRWPAWAGATLAAGAVGLAGWRKHALTLDGAAAATGVGAVTLACGGLPASTALVTFFITSSALSRFKMREKARRGVLAQAKGGRRDAWQVLANGGVAAACLGSWGARGVPGFLGALAAAGADTWATELGLLARRPPRLITSLRPVQPGTSGGITPEGTLAAIAGAMTVGAAWACATRFGLHDGRAAPDVEQGPRVRPSAPAGHSPVPCRAAPRFALIVDILTTTLAGTAGSLFDSFLGATVQAQFWCPTCEEPTEAPLHSRCGQTTRLTRGWRWMDNDAVNALATAAGALSGVALASCTRRTQGAAG